MPNDPDYLLANMSRAARWLLPFFSAPILVALAAYLGLQRLRAGVDHFGMSLGLLDPSVTDYVEWGIGITAMSVFVFALIGLVLFLAHSRVRKTSPATRRIIGIACLSVGGLALVPGLTNRFAPADPIVPMFLAAGVNLAPYGWSLWRGGRGPGGRPTGRAIAATIILINVVLALWITGAHARLSGVALAEAIAESPAVTLCVQKDLGATGAATANGKDGKGGCGRRYPDLRQIACGDSRCLFAQKREDGGYSVFLIHLNDEVSITTETGSPAG